MGACTSAPKQPDSPIRIKHAPQVAPAKKPVDQLQRPTCALSSSKSFLGAARQPLTNLEPCCSLCLQEQAEDKC